MATFTEIVTNTIAPYYYFILFVVVAIIFGLMGKYAYDQYYPQTISSEKNQFDDVANANMRDDEAIIYFFHVKWCPHCKTALPEWSKFQIEYNGKMVNNCLIKCIDMDCTDETPEITHLINDFQIDSYPTVKMIKNNQKIEFDSKITKDTLEQFVNTMTSN